VNATVILYADAVTPAMQQAMDETQRRRERQLAFNAEHGITPRTIVKAIRHGMELELRAARTAREAIAADEKEYEVAELVAELEKQMLAAAAGLEFEKAAAIRDRIRQLKETPQVGKVKRNAVATRKRKPGLPGTRVVKPRKKSNPRP
jgi:excinuclease ABC subunit B